MASNSKNLAELLNSDVTLTATDIANGAVTTDKLAADAITTAKIADTVNLGRRNMIINGAMQVAQRGTSETVTTVQTVKSVDRFRLIGGFSGFSATGTQDTGSTPSGFTTAYKMEVTSSLGTTTSGLYSSLVYWAEGYDIRRLRWGWTDAKSATFSFYVKSSVTGQYGINFTNGTLNYLTSYTVDTANTWERKTITIPGETTGSWNTTNGYGLKIVWDLGVGSVYNSSTTEDWTLSGNIWGLTGGVKLFETNGAVFSITGIQLEVGDTATPFEHLTYAEELRACQRYCEIMTAVNSIYLSPGAGYNSLYRAAHPLLVEKRAAPTITVYGVGGYPNNAGYMDIDGVGNDAVTAQGRINAIFIYGMAAPYSGQCSYKADAEL